LRNSSGRGVRYSTRFHFDEVAVEPAQDAVVARLQYARSLLAYGLLSAAIKQGLSCNLFSISNR